jgi:hypothetical protein
MGRWAELDGERVERDVYERFLAATKEVPGTWYCDDMEFTDEQGNIVGGGETGWEATDAQGKVYRVRESSEPKGATSAITSKGEGP